MISNRVYLFETGTCFTSVSHTEKDLQVVAEALLKTLQDMVREDDLSPSNDSFDPSESKLDGILSADIERQKNTVPMTSTQVNILKECVLYEEADPSNVFGFSFLSPGKKEKEKLLTRLSEVTERLSIMRLRIEGKQPEESNWNHKRKILRSHRFHQSDTLSPSDYINHVTVEETSEVYFESLGKIPTIRKSFILCPSLFQVDLVECSDGAYVLVFGFHHIVFDGYTVEKIRRFLIDGVPSSLEIQTYKEFTDLNHF